MADDTRDEKGRFKKGNPGGPGRPKRAVETDYLRALTEAVSVEDWKRICEKAKDDAQNGDGKAREWLAKYLCDPQQLPPLAILAVRDEQGYDPIQAEAEAMERRQQRAKAWDAAFGDLLLPPSTN